MKSQGGFAAIEIILVMLIISLLATVALPNMAKMVDVAAVDYEMKILLSTLDFAKSSNKNSHYDTTIFGRALAGQNGVPLFLRVDYDKGTYKILSNGENFSEPHELPAGFSISKNDKLNNPIEFDKGNDGHITITSRYGVKRYIYFDSVGRWSGDIKER